MNQPRQQPRTILSLVKALPVPAWDVQPDDAATRKARAIVGAEIVVAQFNNDEDAATRLRLAYNLLCGLPEDDVA